MSSASAEQVIIGDDSPMSLSANANFFLVEIPTVRGRTRLLDNLFRRTCPLRIRPQITRHILCNSRILNIALPNFGIFCIGWVEQAHHFLPKETQSCSFFCAEFCDGGVAHAAPRILPQEFTKEEWYVVFSLTRSKSISVPLSPPKIQFSKHPPFRSCVSLVRLSITF